MKEEFTIFHRKRHLVPSVLNPNKIIKYKYIEKCGKINGFYMGLSALNRYGLTTQVPNTTEICTNNETSKLRSVKVGNMSVILRKSRTAITNENVDILSFLELMNNLSMDSFDDEKAGYSLQFSTGKRHQQTTNITICPTIS